MAARPLRSSSWAFAFPSSNVLHHLLTVHSLHFGRKPRIIQDGFPQNSCFLARRKRITTRGNNSRRTHPNSLCRDKRK
jgi:hypothetical protein